MNPLKTLGVIIISDGHTQALKDMTQKAVDTSLKSGVDTVVMVVEQNRSIRYKNCINKTCTKPFNYNQRLNIAVRELRRMFAIDYFAFCNNDLIFEDGWASALIYEMDKNRCGSASPKCPLRHKDLNKTFISHKVGIAFCGWAFMLKASVYDLIGGLDESFNYWCSDNIVAYQLNKRGINHCITPKSEVAHLSNQSGKHLDKETLLKYTWAEAKKFKQITGVDVFPEDIIKMNLKQ